MSGDAVTRSQLTRTVGSDAIRNRLLAAILAVLTIAGLRAGYSVTMPLAAAAVTVAAIWPLKPWLDQVLPSTVSYSLVVLVLLFLSAGFLGAVYFSLAQVVRAFAENQEQFKSIYGAISGWAGYWGLYNIDAMEGYGQLISFGQTLLANIYSIFGYLGFIAILVILGILEVPALRQRIHDTLGASDRRELIATADEIGDQIRRYLGMTAVTSAITGVASAVWSFSVGLDLALVWGVLNFLLNFIPVVGNIIGIIPPTVYAIIQFQSVTWTLVIFFGFAALQIIISNVIYPMLQGRSLSLSPVVILVALAFWGWVWGIAGALLAVPLTAAIVIICEHFRSTEWIALLLSNRKRGDSKLLERRRQLGPAEADPSSRING